MDKEVMSKEWEDSVKESIMEYMDYFLSIAKTCNMGTAYFHPEKMKYETHSEYDSSKINGVELRIVVEFVDAVDKDKINFI